jgi:hypothetical protein
LEGNTNRQSSKGDTNTKNKRSTLGGKTNTTNRRKPRQNNNRNRANATTNNNNRRKRKNDFSIFGEDSEKCFSLSSVFSSLHNIQNQINMKQMDSDSTFNVAKLKQVKKLERLSK